MGKTEEMSPNKVDTTDDEETTVVVIEDEPETKAKPEEHKPCVVIKNVNPVSLANTNQLMEIFSLDESKRDQVYQWVERNQGKGINEMINHFMDEMTGKL